MATKEKATTNEDAGLSESEKRKRSWRIAYFSVTRTLLRKRRNNRAPTSSIRERFVSAELEKRIKISQFTAFISLLTFIVAALALSALLYISTNQASGIVGLAVSMDKVRSELVAQTKQTRAIEERVKKTMNRLDEEVAAIRAARQLGSKKPLGGIDEYLLGQTQRALGDSISQLTTLQSEGKLSPLLVNVDSAIAMQKRTTTDSVLVTWSSRLPTLLAGLFLIQTLLSVYRYSTRSAAALRSQRNTLALLGIPKNKSDIARFGAVANEMSSETQADFGKTTSPTEGAIEVAKTVATRGKK